MSMTRLFVGGLSDKIDRQDLGSRLLKYGPVSSVDLKEKTDHEGNVVFKFAYVNLDTTPSQVEQCIEELHGASWKGSRLRVELAKESFLDRLNRERTAKKQVEEETVYSRRLNKLTASNQDVNEAETKNTSVDSRKREACEEQQADINTSDIKHISKKRKDRRSSDDLSPKKSKRDKKIDGKVKSPPADTQSSISRKEKKTKNKVEEEILSSFKEFSSVWADSDNENDAHFQSDSYKAHDLLQDDTGIQLQKKPKEKAPLRANKSEDSDATVDEEADSSHGHEDVWKEQQAQLEILATLDKSSNSTPRLRGKGEEASGVQVIRDDSMLQEDQQHKVQPAQEEQTVNGAVSSEHERDSKYVKVSKDLNFGQNSSGFSLLAQFSQLNQGAVNEEENRVAAPVSAPKSVATVQRKVKRRPFFLSADDREIEAAITWMAQSLTDEVIKEFEEVQPELREISKTRAVRAMREQRDSQRRDRGRGRGRGRGGQGRGRPTGSDTGNPYRDHRWRERENKK